jgi:hypothetical protein
MNMLKSNVKRPASRIAPAPAGSRANRPPSTTPETRSIRPKLDPRRSVETAKATPSSSAAFGDLRSDADAIKTQSGVDLAEKIRELLVLAK